MKHWNLLNLAKVLAVQAILTLPLYVFLRSPWYVPAGLLVALVWGIVSGFFWPVRKQA